MAPDKRGEAELEYETQALTNIEEKIQQIRKTHHPDGPDVDVQNLLQILEGIDRYVTPYQPFFRTVTVTDLQGHLADVDFPSTVIIHQISSKISSQPLRKADPHEAALALFNSVLTKYRWDAKLILTMAAFTLNCATLYLLLDSYISNKISVSLSIFRKFPILTPKEFGIREFSERWFGELSDLRQKMKKVSRRVIEFRDLPPRYISLEEPPLSDALQHIPIATYWTIRSALACLTYIAKGSETDKDLKGELPLLKKKLEEELKYLDKQLDCCRQHIEEKKDFEGYLMLLNVLDANQGDNREILRALIPTENDSAEPLFYPRTQSPVNIDALRRKQVILLISNLDITDTEILMLRDIYYDNKFFQPMGEQYEVVWIPVIESPWDESMNVKFEELTKLMPWHILRFPRLLREQKRVIRLIKEVWRFRNKPITVVLDFDGTVVCVNAIHMMWIWGPRAYPFKRTKEESLWSEETWNLWLLGWFGFFYPIRRSIREEMHILLFGGEDLEWLKDFTTAAGQVAEEAQIPLQMVYVGKNENLEELPNDLYWPRTGDVWFFWNRIESMLASKIEIAKYEDNKNDIILQEIKKVVTYHKEGGWALLSKGDKILVNGRSKIFFRVFKDFEKWKEDATINTEFDNRFRNYYDKINKGDDSVGHFCCRFNFPATLLGQIPRKMICPECHSTMERQITLVCCHKDEIIESPQLE
ncbi:hypothetical protein JCGZ_10215 [Jatropha curcas]|uniref:Sieve element occlusion C-terminal domain-containing protein n=1 Tax=Jatropha curcas TaxID=180498 RepID=A0A067LNF1_JATCU|nr:protein SIEVE ELEMENT OCCLUSION B [Jatropha curcas]KDP46375.1 hypothetical protein JCGZ_10215 [Jatropha curcas]